uniref:Uncharacterized protein n=1 Tax=Oryza sativa subsp. japonica TaxID=39947 RepID=Q6ETH3_ORYSJ|nr:hypothetical protein [Oryza sativa Japonica Group]
MDAPSGPLVTTTGRRKEGGLDAADATGCAPVVVIERSLRARLRQERRVIGGDDIGRRDGGGESSGDGDGKGVTDDNQRDILIRSTAENNRNIVK